MSQLNENQNVASFPLSSWIQYTDRISIDVSRLETKLMPLWNYLNKAYDVLASDKFLNAASDAGTVLYSLLTLTSASALVILNITPIIVFEINVDGS